MDAFVQWWLPAAESAIIVFLTVSAAAGLCSINVAWRRRLPIIAPLALGITTATVALWWLFGPDPRLAPRADRILFGSAEATTWWLGLIGLVIAVGGAWLSFQAEAALLRWRTGRQQKRQQAWQAAMPEQLRALNLPHRAETMEVVADSARKPIQYWAVSGISASGEEFLYRGVMLAAAAHLGWLPLAIAVLTQAAFYGLNHIGFGLRSVLGKILLGVVLGVAALFGGALVTITAHLLYQYWVGRQFTRPTKTVKQRQQHVSV